MVSIEWLVNGTLKGNPSSFMGCETVCGVKQNWKIGITPTPTYKPSKRINRTFIKATPFINNFIISLDVEDTSGGACISKWKTSKPQSSHKVSIKLQQYAQDKKPIKDSNFILVGGSTISIPISQYGSYLFEISSLEWGEECNKPSKTAKWTIVVEEPNTKQNNLADDGADDETTTTLINSALYPIAMLGGAGVIIAISSLMSSR